MNEKPAQALLKILRDSDRAVAPSLTELHPLGLEYDAELSALVSPEYLGFVVRRPRRAGDLLYFYSKRERFYGLGEEWGWGKWQKRNLGKDRNEAAMAIAGENSLFEDAKAMDGDAFGSRLEDWVMEERISASAEWYAKRFGLMSGVEVVPVVCAFTSLHDAVLLLANGHAIVAQVTNPARKVDPARKGSLLERLTCPKYLLRSYDCPVYFSLPLAFAKCYGKPTFDPDLLAEWKKGYSIKSIGASLCSADAMEQAIALEKGFHAQVTRPDQFPVLER